MQEEAAEAMDQARLLPGGEEEEEEEEEDKEGPSYLFIFPRVAALVVDSGSGLLPMLVFLVMFLHALCSLRPSACLSFQASWPVCSRRTVVC